MARAVRAGVTKAHQISFTTDGGLLQELFTADGVGTQIIEEKAQPVRAAKLEDVGDMWRSFAHWKNAAPCCDVHETGWSKRSNIF